MEEKIRSLLLDYVQRKTGAAPALLDLHATDPWDMRISFDLPGSGLFEIRNVCAVGGVGGGSGFGVLGFGCARICGAVRSESRARLRHQWCVLDMGVVAVRGGASHTMRDCAGWGVSACDEIARVRMYVIGTGQ